jgi:hypothetical protein
MNGDTPDARYRERRTRSCRAAGLAGAVVGIALLCTACGSGPSLGVASLGSTTTTTAAGGSGAPSDLLESPQQAYQQDVSYTECMRSHGLSKFPDPTLNARGETMASSPYDTNSPQYQSANSACKHLLPNNGGPPTPAEIATATAQLLKYSQCMRAHGEPNFPDPTVSPHFFGFRISAMDASSPQFQAAQKACQSLPGAP